MWMKYFALLALLVATRAYEVPDAVRTLGLEEASFDQLPTPEELVFKLSEEDFEDYLSYYLFKKAQPAQEIEVKDVRASCSVTVASLSEPQPIYASGGALLAPNGNTGSIAFSDGQVVALACPGSGLSLSSASTTPASANVVCSGGTAFTGSGWFSGTASFASIGCTSHPSNVQARAGTCVDGGSIITIGLAAGGATHTIITSCFHESKAEVFYTIFDQNPDNAQYMSGVARPSFGQGSWFPGLSVDTLYTQVSQTAAFNTILGSGMATQYINTTYFLARGHLAAKTDFVFSPAQRATFSFVNAAPQWQPFNGGNWNTLEQNLRTRIGAAGSRTKIYTGTWGNLELKDSSGVFRKLYLSPSTTQIPVPLWYYKVVHEPSTNRATAFLGLNNPHVTLAEARALAFCTDVCTGSTAFSWLNWQATNIGLGFSICCQVADFRRTVTQLPSFTTSGIFS